MSKGSDWSEFLAEYEHRHGTAVAATIPAVAFDKADGTARLAFETQLDDASLTSAQRKSLQQEMSDARLALPDIEAYLRGGDQIANAGATHANTPSHAEITAGGYDFVLHGAYVDAHWDALVNEVPLLKEFEEFERGKARQRSNERIGHGSQDTKRFADDLKALGYPGEDVSVRSWARHVAKAVGLENRAEGLLSRLEEMGFDRKSGDTVQTWLDKIGFDPAKGISLEDFMGERGTRSPAAGKGR